MYRLVYLGHLLLHWGHFKISPPDTSMTKLMILSIHLTKEDQILTVDRFISVWSGYSVASFTGATTTETINDAGAAVVEATAGQADAAKAGDDDEQDEGGCYQPDPPDDPTLPINVYNNAVIRLSWYTVGHGKLTGESVIFVAISYQIHTGRVRVALAAPKLLQRIRYLLLWSWEMLLDAFIPEFLSLITWVYLQQFSCRPWKIWLKLLTSLHF